jgi:UV DNA damage repair endonuclease
MWTTILPRDSAWSAASSTGAIAFMSYDEVKVYSKLYAMQNLYSMLVERNLAERHDLNVVLFGMEATGKLSEAEFEKGRAIVLSAKIRSREMLEVDNALNTNYTRLLSHEH